MWLEAGQSPPLAGQQLEQQMGTAAWIPLAVGQEVHMAAASASISQPVACLGRLGMGRCIAYLRRLACTAARLAVSQRMVLGLRKGRSDWVS